MQNYLNNCKVITLDTTNLIDTLRLVRKRQKRVTLITDYNTKTMYIEGKDITHTLKGF